MSIVADVRVVLNDSGVFWPDATVLDAINEAQFLVYAETKWAITTATLTASANSDILTIPSTILVPKWIEGSNTLFSPPVVRRFFPSTHRNLESFLRTWKGQGQGQPGFFIIWDATHLRIFPRPDVTYEFTIFGIGFPTEIADANASLSGPPAFKSAVLYGACALLFEATRPDLADMYMAQAMEQVLILKKTLRNNHSHNIRTLVPATQRLQIEQSGEISQTPTYYPVEA